MARRAFTSSIFFIGSAALVTACAASPAPDVPTKEQIAARCGTTVAKLREAQRRIHATTKLQTIDVSDSCGFFRDERGVGFFTIERPHSTTIPLKVN